MVQVCANGKCKIRTTSPRWIQSAFTPWLDPATKLQGVIWVGEGDAAFDLPIFRSKRKLEDVCLGGNFAPDSHAPVGRNYLVVVPANEVGRSAAAMTPVRNPPSLLL